ncbi:MAG TPA: hypothetical protein VE219_07125, partial [Candidatus Sulfotelmatobacter sp.]|nr:hypothetical protein [Candidatus Sulfotelmatobacter sp.]
SSAATVTVVSDAGRGSLYTANYVRTGDRLLATSEPSRLGLDEWRRELAENAETTVVTLDEGLAQADPADPDGDHAGDDVPTILLGRAEQALAACVPLALSHPPLALAGLAAQYVGGALALRKAGV